MDEFRYKRMAAVPRRITEINPEKDVRVRILGRVIDKSDGTLVVDDGSSTAQIVTDATANIDDFVCVFARVLPLENGYELRGEIVQNRNSMDMELHKRVYGE